MSAQAGTYCVIAASVRARWVTLNQSEWRPSRNPGGFRQSSHSSGPISSIGFVKPRRLRGRSLPTRASPPPLLVGLSVVMEQERTLSRFAEPA
jgi:hypothetical protein